MSSSLVTADEDVVRPPAAPDLGPPIHDKQIDRVPTIGTDEPSRITKPVDPKIEAEARALDRALDHTRKPPGR
jgi:hypothetical protein